ncbi:CHASE2 domain-containing protein [Pyruvatibacter sp.]|uniref:CHASE2 domain-containing protein n=1 Tax=Pyruvatibacter sp. TaxID=1981328 RepID=UPI0032EE7C23
MSRSTAQGAQEPAGRAKPEKLIETDKGMFDANFLLSLALALIVWAILRTPEGWQTFLGEADREVLQIAFELRVNQTVQGTGPILFLNLDESVWESDETDGPALAYAPRKVVADMLEAAYGIPGFPRPKVVVADIDLFWRTPEEEQEARIDTILTRWGADADAPLLVMQREVVDGDGHRDQPARARGSAREQILANAPAQNIVWSVAQITGDEIIGARYFAHYLCVKGQNGPEVVPTTALYAIAGRTAATAHEATALVDRAMTNPRRFCVGETDNPGFTLERTDRDTLVFQSQESFINYSAHPGNDPVTEPSLVAADMFYIPAGFANAPMVSGLASGGGIVIIGSAATMARDRHMTPYGQMGGSMVIANMIRGLEEGGEIRRLHWAVDAAMLTIFVTMIVASFWYARIARDWIGPTTGRPLFQRIIRWPIKLLTNPVIVKLLIGVGIFWVSTFASYLLLDNGIWVSFAAPAYVAALNEAREDFEELMENLRNARTNAA